MASVAKREWAYKGQNKTAWVLRYVDMDGNRRQETYQSKKAADRARLKVETEIDMGEHVAHSASETIGLTANAYLRHLEDRLRAGSLRRTTYESESSAVKACVIPLIGHIRWSNLNSNHVIKWFEDLMTKRKMKINSARVRVRMLRSIETFARRKGYTRRSIVSEAIPDLPKTNKKVRVRAFTVEEVERLLEIAAQPKDPHSKAKYRHHAMYEVIVNIAAYCGLRIGEILGLRFRDVDHEKRRLYVRQQVNRFAEVSVPKTDSGIRDVPMPESVSRLIEGYAAKYGKANKADLLFVTDKLTPMVSPNIHNMAWRPLLKRAGLMDGGKPYHFHALRHFTISFMIENGIPPATVSKLVGHSNVGITLAVYTRSVRELDAFQADFDRIGGLLGGTKSKLDATRDPHGPVNTGI